MDYLPMIGWHKPKSNVAPIMYVMSLRFKLVIFTFNVFFTLSISISVSLAGKRIGIVKSLVYARFLIEFIYFFFKIPNNILSILKSFPSFQKWDLYNFPQKKDGHSTFIKYKDIIYKRNVR